MTEQEQLKRLKEFAHKLIENECWGFNNPDGADIEELAEKLQLVYLDKVTAEDVKDENNYFSADDIGTMAIYRFADWMEEE